MLRAHHTLPTLSLAHACQSTRGPSPSSASSELSSLRLGLARWPPLDGRRAALLAPLAGTLRSLSLDSCHLGRDAGAELGQLSSLTRLALGAPRVEDDLPWLRGMAGLRSLELTGVRAAAGAAPGEGDALVDRVAEHIARRVVWCGVVRCGAVWCGVVWWIY